MPLATRDGCVSSYRLKALYLIFAIGLAVVDCSASMGTIDMLMKAAESGCCVVLANKKPLTSTLVTSRY